MDPHSFEKLDPDVDPDPHKVDADPKHCKKASFFKYEMIPLRFT
jgi:hypothetical protein